MSLLNVKYIDLPVTLGGRIEIEGNSEDFKALIFDNLEVGGSYSINLLHNGVPLLIDDENVSSLVFTVPDRSNSFSILGLRQTIEEFIRESDLVRGIYKENNLDTYDDSIPLSIFEEYDLHLSLACLKQGF